jgi:hypothetical protein
MLACESDETEQPEIIEANRSSREFPGLDSPAARRKEVQLLQSELDGNSQVHWDGCAIQRRGLIFPLLQGVHGRLL